ncbi:sensor histidine kinase [Spirillospora sp. CA-253888]
MDAPAVPRASRRPSLETAVAAGVTVLVVAATVGQALRTPAQSPARTALDWALILTTCGAMFLVRRHPLPACLYVIAAAGVYYVTSPVDGPLVAALMVVLYGVAATGRTVAAAALAAFSVASVMLSTLRGNKDMNTAALVMMTGWIVAVVALGAAAHGRRLALRAAAERAAEQARLRATEERLRIARELHDAVGHNISMINVQAGTALHRMAADPGRAEAALAVIKDASRQTLRELRATLGVLRQVDEDAPVRPPGGLARLAELARHAELAGLAATVRVRGEARPLQADLDLAAYRILQESITNVVRHAGSGTVRVLVDYGATALGLEVEDDGAPDGSGAPGRTDVPHGDGGATATGGSGITGMRERARALGGALDAGPRPGGGFRVRARLPYGTGEPV